VVCVQMALPLFTICLAAVICFSVASFIVPHAKPHPVSLWRSHRKPRSGEIF
jgi:hypothetical protein